MSNLSKKQSGFTLVELMVVMAIIAILATASVASYANYIQKARDTSALAEMQEMYNTIQLIGLNDSRFPIAAAGVGVDGIVKKLKDNSGKVFKHPSDNIDECVKTTDDSNAAVIATLGKCRYQYASCDGGEGFILRTNLENDSAQYKKDVITGTFANTPANLNHNFFELGNCNVPDKKDGTTEIINTAVTGGNTDGDLTFISPALPTTTIFVDIR